MDIEWIFDIFCRLTNLDKSQAAGLKFLCEGAMDYVQFRLAAPVERENSCRVSFAAAALACYRLALLGLTGGSGSEIKIGDLTVKKAGMERLQAAESLCREAFDAIHDLTVDNQFAFKGV